MTIYARHATSSGDIVTFAERMHFVSSTSYPGFIN